MLPVAIDRTVLIAARSVQGSRKVEMKSVNYENSANFDLDKIEPTDEKELQ